VTIATGNPLTRLLAGDYGTTVQEHGSRTASASTKDAIPCGILKPDWDGLQNELDLLLKEVEEAEEAEEAEEVSIGRHSSSTHSNKGRAQTEYIFDATDFEPRPLPF
jgi:hypothetical protein